MPQPHSAAVAAALVAPTLLAALLLPACAAGGPTQSSPPSGSGQAAPPATAKDAGGAKALTAEEIAALPLITVDGDDTVITASCRLAFPATPIVDAKGDGVVKITGSNIVVDGGTAPLLGAAPTALPDTFTGTGIVVTGTNVTLRHATVRGFKCGVLAQQAHGSTFEKLVVSDNYATHLLSTTRAEDGADWLWPHDNDRREWVTRYGAGLCIERSDRVTVRDVLARDTQNGILLDRVNDSRVYDCDCSFLSGWGLAMWRSSRNTICRNAFDFCIRGYSHGAYNRGQDSAGMLVFEQCSGNVIALNSLTHGGDGLFGFAGKEAIGESPSRDGASYARRGSNDNVIVGNDFSFAAAHGLEMTFGFGNVIAHNTFEGNGICGVWAGYSSGTLIAENVFTGNGAGSKDPPPGTPDPRAGEGGAIDIEHGTANRIDSNTFTSEGTAIELWFDEDRGLMSGPWAKANGALSKDNIVVNNAFERCGVALALRETSGTVFLGNRGEAKVEHDDASELASADAVAQRPAIPSPSELAKTLPGLNTPVGARRSLGGREAIRMTAWGPWDHATSILSPERLDPDLHVWRVFGWTKIKGGEVAGGGSLRLHTDLNAGTFGVNLEVPGHVSPYLLRARFDDKILFAEGCIYHADWQVTFFPSPVDPRSDLAAWREGAQSEKSVTVEAPSVNFQFKEEGPTSLKLDDASNQTLKEAAAAGDIKADQFGAIARARLSFPAGTFTIRTVSDDGVRVLVDGKVVVEDWAVHAPHEATGTISFTELTDVDVVVEYFDLEGPALLQMFIDGEIDAQRRAVFGQKKP